MRFGDEPIALTEYRAPRGRPDDDALGFRAGTMVRDPDGHALRVVAH